MPEVVAPIVSVVARRIHDRMYPGTSADCKLCPELAAIAVDAALTELSAAGRLLPEGATHRAVIWGLRHSPRAVEVVGDELLARRASEGGDGVLVRQETVVWPDGTELIKPWSVVEPVAVKEASE